MLLPGAESVQAIVGIEEPLRNLVCESLLVRAPEKRLRAAEVMVGWTFFFCFLKRWR